MNREYQVITDIYNEQGNVVKKNVLYNKVFETNDMHVESYVEDNGKITSKYTGVVYNDKYYKINKPFNEVSKEVRPIIIEGFNAKRKSYRITKITKPTNEDEEYEDLPDHLKELEEQDDDNSELSHIIEGKSKPPKNNKTNTKTGKINKCNNGRKGSSKSRGKQVKSGSKSR